MADTCKCIRLVLDRELDSHPDNNSIVLPFLKHDNRISPISGGDIPEKVDIEERTYHKIKIDLGDGKIQCFYLNWDTTPGGEEFIMDFIKYRTQRLEDEKNYLIATVARLETELILSKMRRR